MAQFDVYENPSVNTRTAFPYLVDVQSPVIEDISTRIVVPIGKLQSFKNQAMTKLTPEINYDGERLLLLVPQIAAIPAKYLKAPIGSLAHFRDDIIAAVDFAITGV
ncbi:CcdB family protein [Spongiibacter taiwanensis]|uniref:CcdB family protein n=1 Tax=Spongiibacter taiwanensis TaxID=1748242 RepID=UPI0020350D3D|nr:CcdB family protein [Spongiibacter taiwanensis]USA43847.1 CcdB family protein [Spongiibacter taiwanensis]